MNTITERHFKEAVAGFEALCAAVDAGDTASKEAWAHATKLRCAAIGVDNAALSDYVRGLTAAIGLAVLTAAGCVEDEDRVSAEVVAACTAVAEYAGDAISGAFLTGAIAGRGAASPNEGD